MLPKRQRAGSVVHKEEALLFTGLLYVSMNSYLVSRDLLIDAFGPAIIESDEYTWDFSKYYSMEMGSGIKRRFILFDTPYDVQQISDTKLKTIEMEWCLSDKGKRTVNIDPGYLTLAKVVLATTKNYSHRIYLKDGIYAEVTLTFKRGGSYEPHMYTYRDYTEGVARDFLARGRDILLQKTNGNDDLRQDDLQQ
ncbi:MAG: DUF4416 family protein [Nitrospirae bacterium]|nr:DUF4416 family protein [Nitrospirota bacterium]